MLSSVLFDVLELNEQKKAFVNSHFFETVHRQTAVSYYLKRWSITKSHKSAGFGMGWTLRALAFRRSLTYCMATTSEKRWRLTRVSRQLSSIRTRGS
jgi:hypothetical protein